MVPDCRTEFILNYFPSGNSIADEVKIRIFQLLRDRLSTCGLEPKLRRSNYASRCWERGFEPPTPWSRTIELKILSALRRLFFTVMSRDLESRDFAHPFWWAAFYLTGV